LEIGDERYEHFETKFKAWLEVNFKNEPDKCYSNCLQDITDRITQALVDKKFDLFDDDNLMEDPIILKRAHLSLDQDRIEESGAPKTPLFRPQPINRMVTDPTPEKKAYTTEKLLKLMR
jgi:hypothetical protein